jgi:hypothetical protein
MREETIGLLEGMKRADQVGIAAGNARSLLVIVVLQSLGRWAGYQR